ncbi:MAG: light-harvesting antenna LH1, beta subunit [Hyphococcus sp.]
MASDTPGRSESLSGMTPAEAQEFHKLFMMSFIIFTLIAVVAHFLVWMWRPWIPGPEGYSALEEGVRLAGSLPGLFG